MTIAVYLQRDVAGLGRSGQIVNVSQAYARNFLLPKGLVMVATPALMAKAKQQAGQAHAAAGQAAAAAEQAATTLAGQSVRLSGRANPQGKLFAAVKAEQVLMAIHSQYGLRLPPTTTMKPAQLKTLGDHHVQLSLSSQMISCLIHLDHADAA